ncbi:MAG: hypothetical protein K9J17_01810 [Flavobacteriales bacterium]|nr:hypothetical protein [Flavobacteriales bacterium]
MRVAVISASLVLAFVLALSGIFDNEAMYGLIHADAQGYYGYLVAIFLEHSFNWDQVIHSYADVYFDGGGADFTVVSDLGRINKYYAGTAILTLPFFLLSCGAAFLFGFPVDGYSSPFQYGIMLSALFYSGVGMYFLSKFLEAKGIERKTALFAVVCCLFATGLFHYAISEPAMSHAYSFALFCAFLYTVQQFIQVGSQKYWIASAAIFALIVLVRPANGLVLLSVPFIAGGIEPIRTRLIQAFGSKMIFAMIVVVGILSLQSLMYVLQVGKPLVWSYQGEGFNFLSPEILNVLFSFKKGFFVYSPVAFLGAIGLVLYLFKRPKEASWLWAFLAISIYVISCWWNWYYGGSFGMRALIEYLPFFIFGLAFLIQNSGRLAKGIVITFCLLFVSVNLVQSYQYQKFILHWDGMDKDRYWQVFMQTGREYDGIFYRQEKVLEIPNDESVLSRVDFHSGFEENDNWGTQGVNTEMAFAGTKSTKLTGDAPFGSTLGVPVAALGSSGNKKLLITAQVWSEEAFPNLTIAYSYRNDSTDYGHDYIGIGQYVSKPAEWMEVKHIADLREAADTTDQWIVYPYLSNSGKVYVDDVTYEVITLKD